MTASRRRVSGKKPSLVLWSVLSLFGKSFLMEVCAYKLTELNSGKNKLYNCNLVLVEILRIIVLNLQWKDYVRLARSV